MQLFPKSLKKRMLLLTTLISVLPVVILFVFWGIHTKSNIETQINQQYYSQLDNFSNYLNRTFQTYLSNAEQIVHDPQISRGLSEDYSNNLRLKSQFYVDIKLAFFNINLFSKDYTVYYTNQDLFDYKNFQSLSVLPSELVEEVSNSNFGVWKVQRDDQNQSEDELSFMMKFDTPDPEKAILKVDISFDTLYQIYQESFDMEHIETYYMADDQAVFNLTNPDGTGISEDNQHPVISKRLNNGHYISMLLHPSPLPMQFVMQYVYMLLIFIGSIAAICLLDYIMISKLTGSLENFIGQLNRVGYNGVGGIEITEQDEIGIIKHKFVDLLEQNEKLYTQNIMAEKNKKLMEISLIHSRLNPHLLYNSLSVIKWKALAKNDQETSQLIDHMTKYYRAALSKGEPIFTFAQEMELVKNYVEINRYAHGADYKLEIDVTPDIYSKYTLKLLLQPFVENAILHGLNSIDREKRLKISGRLDCGDIVFTVEDNGYGIPKEKLAMLNSPIPRTQSFGYGIRNIAERIQVYFGPDYGIHYESEENVYTRVSIRVPALTEEQLMQKLNF